MALRPTQGDENAFYPAATLHGSVALPFVIPSTSTCLRQVEGLNDTGLSALATKDGVAHSSLLLA